MSKDNKLIKDINVSVNHVKTQMRPSAIGVEVILTYDKDTYRLSEETQSQLRMELRRVVYSTVQALFAQYFKYFIVKSKQDIEDYYNDTGNGTDKDGIIH